MGYNEHKERTGKTINIPLEYYNYAKAQGIMGHFIIEAIKEYALELTDKSLNCSEFKITSIRWDPYIKNIIKIALPFSPTRSLSEFIRHAMERKITRETKPKPKKIKLAPGEIFLEDKIIKIIGEA